MKNIRLLSLTLTALAVTACSDSTAPVPAPRTVHVSPVGAFGPSGTVSLTNVAGPNSTLTATLTGFDANSSHAVGIVLGSCASQGSTAFTLPNILATSSGQATIPSTSAPDGVVTSGYAIVFYQSTSSTSDVIACGNLS